MRRQRIRYRMGVALLALNYPVGYTGLWAAGIVFIKTRTPLWLALGAGVYLFSWVMLIAGFLLAGQEGLQQLRFFWRRTKHRLQFLRMKVDDEKDTGTPGDGL